MASHEDAWRNTRHREQWRNSFAMYVYPVLGELPIAAVDTGLVMKVIEPLWKTRTETASRVRGRIEAVLDWAKVRGYRSDENPARWRGHLDHLLPKRSKVRRVQHHPALPYAEVGTFMATLRQQTSIGAIVSPVLPAVRIVNSSARVDLAVLDLPRTRGRSGRRRP